MTKKEQDTLTKELHQWIESSRSTSQVSNSKNGDIISSINNMLQLEVLPILKNIDTKLDKLLELII